MFGVMTAVFTRRLRLFILLFLAEGLETSASFALSFRFFFSFSRFSSVPGVRAPRLPFPHLPPTNPKGRLEVESSAWPPGKEMVEKREPLCPGDVLCQGSITTLPSAIHSSSTCLSQVLLRGLLRVSFYPTTSPPPHLTFKSAFQDLATSPFPKFSCGRHCPHLHQYRAQVRDQAQRN